MKIDMIVLNYEGERLLREFLPSVIDAAENSQHDCHVIVLDNQSTDGSETFVKENFPDAEFIKAKENKVYSSFNEIVGLLDSDIVILLNNDMKLEKGFVDPIVAPFLEKEDIFFVATHGDRSIVNDKWGIFSADIAYPESKEANEHTGYTFSAGVGAFDRKKFVELEGYDEIYLPGRYEDVDLCFRGWKRGWKGLYAPESKKVHVGAASFKEHFKEREIAKLVFRNSILFTLKNVTDPILIVKALGLTILRTLYYLLTGKWHMVQGFFTAICRAKEAMRKRPKAWDRGLLKDKEIVRKINGNILDRPTTFKGKVINSIKNSIVNLDKSNNSVKSKIFLNFLFPVGMLFFPLEYVLIRELIGCKKILDLGCGSHSMVGILPKEHFHTVGIELFDLYLDKAIESGRHSEYIRADMREVSFGENSFDAVVLLDVIEHLKKEEGLALLEKAEKWAYKKMIVNTPNGFFEQSAYDENDLQEHLSGWEINEFKGWGFSINGLRGFNWMHVLLERSKLSGRVKEIFDRTINIFNFIVYFFPQKAHQLFCVKHILGK